MLTREFQVDDLERDALEVLRLVRSVKNSFAPIGRIPPEVLSLIPDYYGEEDGDDTDEDLIASTHVCRGWRDVLISRPSLWTKLDFKNVDKTHNYIQRSQSFPLQLRLEDDDVIDEAFPLIIPHLGRVGSLTVNAALPSFLEHFRCHIPHLEILHINIATEYNPVLDDALFNGDLSSLRELHLTRVLTNLPWENLANLQVVELVSAQNYGTAQILDFLGSAPLLRTISLDYPMPDSSDAPPERIVPLHHLKAFNIQAGERYPTLLRHLRIPIGASLVSRFNFHGDESPLLAYLPERSPNSTILSHVTTINLLFDSTQKFALLTGPSGSLCVLAEWRDWWGPSSPTLDRRILRSLDLLTLSTTQRLTISRYHHPRPDNVKECPISQILLSMNNLRTLTLIDCDNRPFVLALDPEQNPSNFVRCSSMEELVVCVWSPDQFHLEHFTSMTENRASRGAKLSSITFVHVYGLALEKEVFELKEHVTHVECRVDDRPPPWDDVPGENGRERRRFWG